MRNKECHILYILHIPKLRAYKIGISEISRINNRVKEIERDFGKVKKTNSVFYHSKSAKTIKNIEKGLHHLSWEYSKEIKKNGSGKTEFFKESIKPHLDKLLKTSTKMYNLEGPIFLEKTNKKINFGLISIIISLLVILYTIL